MGYLKNTIKNLLNLSSLVIDLDNNPIYNEGILSLANSI